MSIEPVDAAVASRCRGARHGISRPHGTQLLGWAGAGLLLAVTSMAVLAPLLAGHDPQVVTGLPFERPSSEHLLGTDDIGRDIAAQLVYGARISLAIAFLSAIVATSLGAAVALIAGYFRGIAEGVLMRLVDVTLAFPFLPLVIVLAAFLGRGLLITVLVIAAVTWARPARVLRSQVVKVRQYQHVVAAQAMGAHPAYVIVRHVLPRILPLAVAQFVRVANVAVLLEASLAFLGLGDLTQDSWGTILYYANSHNAILTDAWLWWILPPGLALAATILGLALVGYRVEEWADPRLALASTAPIRVAPPPSPSTDGTAPPRAVAEPSQPGAVLAIRDLRVWYATPAGPVRAVDGVDLALRPGSILGLVGESGCGKSTLAMTVMGLIRPPGTVIGGTIELVGDEILQSGRVAAVRGRRIALIPQGAMNALNPTYTIHAQVRESANLTRTDASADAHAHDALRLVGLPADRHGAYPHELSGGMRQRVLIAMAISNEPLLLVADEPVTGLDVVTQGHVLRLLRELRSRLGMAMLIISHDLPLVGRIADDLTVMYAGRIVEAGTARSVIETARHPYSRALVAAFPDLDGPRRTGGSIAGEPPDLLAPPPGCRFQPRCPSAFEACAVVDPVLYEPLPGRRCACLLDGPYR